MIGTFYNGTTIILKEYNGTTTSVKIAVGEKDFYVLDSPTGRIDRFDRENRTFQDYFVVADTPTDLTVVQGELKLYSFQKWRRMHENEARMSLVGHYLFLSAKLTFCYCFFLIFLVSVFIYGLRFVSELEFV